MLVGLGLPPTPTRCFGSPGRDGGRTGGLVGGRGGGVVGGVDGVAVMGTARSVGSRRPRVGQRLGLGIPI